MNHLRAYLHGYRDYLDSSPLQPTSRRQYYGHAITFINWMMDQPDLAAESLDSSEKVQLVINNYVRYMYDELGLKAGSVNATLASIKNFIHAVCQLHVQLPRVEEPPAKPKLLSAAERIALTNVLYSIATARERLLILLFLMAGLRTRECAALNIRDVDEGFTRLHVRGKIPRCIPLNSALGAAVAGWLEVRPQTNSLAMFLNKDMKRLSIASIEEATKKVGRYARLDISPHLLRNTCIQGLLDAGADSMVVACLTGADPATLLQFVNINPSRAGLFMESLAVFPGSIEELIRSER